MHRTTAAFWKRFGDLPDEIQRTARASFQLLKNDSRHPSLHFKRVGKFWSARVGIAHRALATQDGEDFTWVWIGGHDDYEQLING